MHMYAIMRVYVCVCVCERERERGEVRSIDQQLG